MQTDKALHGIWNSNVKAHSFSSTQMGTLLLALKRWIVRITSLVYPLESHHMLGTYLSHHRKHTLKSKQLRWLITALFPTKTRWLSVLSIICGVIRHSGLPELRSHFHLQCGFEGMDIYHHQHPQGSTAHSHITLIRILWEVIPLTLPLTEVHCRHGRGKTNHIYYLS